MPPTVAEIASAAVSPTIELEVAGRAVTVSNPDKVYFGAGPFTKLDLVRYYLAVGEPVMRQMLERPVMLQRFPDGASGSSFYQKRIPAGAPEWLNTMDVTTPAGTVSRALVIADLAHLVWAVNLGCIGFHSWPVRRSRPDECDELRIDLDPGPGTDFAMVRRAAAATKELLDEQSMLSYVKSSGSRGLHIYVRLERGVGSLVVRRAAVALARELERRRPELLTASWWKEERGARIFVDYNQNAPHKTVFAPWSVRAYDHAPVSCPFEWAELDDFHPHRMTIASVPARVAAQGDPWADIDRSPQSLAGLLVMADRDDAAGLPDAPWPPQYPKMAGEAPRVAPSRARRAAPEGG